jgi:hypothetical protein
MITSNSNNGLPEGDAEPTDASPGRKVRVVRYSLSEMLAEVDQERRRSDMGREMVDQSEIKTLFKSKRKNRGSE